jgi:hypothetical protein
LSTVNKVKILATIALVVVGTYIVMHIGIDTTVAFLLATFRATLIAAAIVGLGVCLFAIWLEMRSS